MPKDNFCQTIPHGRVCDKIEEKTKHRLRFIRQPEPFLCSLATLAHVFDYSS